MYAVLRLETVWKHGQSLPGKCTTALQIAYSHSFHHVSRGCQLDAFVNLVTLSYAGSWCCVAGWCAVCCMRPALTLLNVMLEPSARGGSLIQVWVFEDGRGPATICCPGYSWTALVCGCMWMPIVFDVTLAWDATV